MKALPFSLQGHFTLLNTLEEEDGKPLLYTPDEIGNIGLHFDRKEIGWNLQLQYTGERRNTVSDYLDGFVCVSANMFYRPPIYENRFDITLVVENLFRQNIQAFPGFPEPGRTFKLSLGYTQP